MPTDIYFSGILNINCKTNLATKIMGGGINQTNGGKQDLTPSDTKRYYATRIITHTTEKPMEPNQGGIKV